MVTLAEELERLPLAPEPGINLYQILSPRPSGPMRARMREASTPPAIRIPTPATEAEAGYWGVIAPAGLRAGLAAASVPRSMRRNAPGTRWLG